MEPLKSKKRKIDDAAGGKKVLCIIHKKDSKCEQFTYISKTKDPAERFKHIKDIQKKRLSQPLYSSYRMVDICEQIPDEVSDEHGYHRDCYAHFTSNLNRPKL